MKRPTIILFVEKRRIYYIVALIIVMAIIALLPYNSIQNVMSFGRIKPLHNKTIVIDPGHGGIDGGTYYKDILEKNINLEIGLKLKDQLSKKGATVVMTREIDDSLEDDTAQGSRHRRDLSTRVSIVNDSEADIFISVHVNHSKNTNRLGPIVYHYTDSQEGKSLAEHIQKYLHELPAYKKMDVMHKHNVTSGDYYVLRNSISPGVIVETGFISSEIDRKLLLEKEHQGEIVDMIIKGIISYFNEED